MHDFANILISLKTLKTSPGSQTFGRLTIKDPFLGGKRGGRVGGEIHHYFVIKSPTRKIAEKNRLHSLPFPVFVTGN